MQIKLPSIQWTIFWVLVHSLSVLFTSLLLVSISNEILFIIDSGLGVAVIAKFVRSFTRQRSLELNRNFVYWICFTIFSFGICRTFLLFTGIKSGLWYYLLMGLGIFVTAWIIQRVLPLSMREPLGKKYSSSTSHGNSKKNSHTPIVSAPAGNDSYLIEIRIVDRRLKEKIKGLENEITEKFSLKNTHFVPHISLAGGLSTSNERRLVSVFTDLCSQTPVMTFRIGGFSAFEDPKRVVYFDIKPSEDLKQFRYVLARRLKTFCKLKSFDLYGKDEFVFHSTLALNVPDLKFKKLQEYVWHKHYDSSAYCISRITLVKNSRILCEYDFFQKRMLSRDEAKAPGQYHITENLVNQYIIPQNPVKKETPPIFEMKSSFFLMSDTHFDHRNIIEYCKRPFSNREQMNQTLLKNWNSHIKKSDTVFFLGDMSFGRHSRNAQYWQSQLNGKQIFIIGSHDNPPPQAYLNQAIVRYKGREFLLVHNPRDPDRIPKGWSGWIIHGHKHNNSMGKFPFINGENKTINVSVELINYKPVNIDQILALDLDSIQRMSTLDSEPVWK